MQVALLRMTDFLENQSQPLQVNDVEICYEADGSIYISSDIPGLKKEIIGRVEELVLISEFTNVYEFMYEFIMTCPEDLKSITSEHVYKRFLVGRCDLGCYLDENLEFVLFFRWEGITLFATDKDEQRHNVPAQIQSVEDMITYTRHYYLQLYH